MRSDRGPACPTRPPGPTRRRRSSGLAAMRIPIACDSVIRAGVDGRLPDTPKPGHPSVARAMARVIGSRMDAMEGARAAAVERGYRAIVMPEAVTGEARDAAPAWLRSRARAARAITATGLRDLERRNDRPRHRHGHRAGAISSSRWRSPSRWRRCRGVAMASIGTDGIDGSSGVAGGIVDSTTMARAARRGPRAAGRIFLQRTIRSRFSRRWAMSSGWGAPTPMSETYRYY